MACTNAEAGAPAVLTVFFPVVHNILDCCGAQLGAKEVEDELFSLKQALLNKDRKLAQKAATFEHRWSQFLKAVPAKLQMSSRKQDEDVMSRSAGAQLKVWMVDGNGCSNKGEWSAKSTRNANVDRTGSVVHWPG